MYNFRIQAYETKGDTMVVRAGYNLDTIDEVCRAMNYELRQHHDIVRLWFNKTGEILEFETANWMKNCLRYSVIDQMQDYLNEWC